MDAEVIRSEIPVIEPILRGSDFLSFDVPPSAAAQPGIYFLLSHGDIVYVGKAHNVRRRLGGHLAEGLKVFDSVAFLPCASSQLDIWERYFIVAMSPTYNACAHAIRTRNLVSEGADPLALANDVTGRPLLLSESTATAMTGMSAEELRRSGITPIVGRSGRERSRVNRFRAVDIIVRCASNYAGLASLRAGVA